jgi:hypothetical protein
MSFFHDIFNVSYWIVVVACAILAVIAAYIIVLALAQGFIDGFKAAVKRKNLPN